MHLTYVPWIAAAGELKTKPTQHTVQKLREIGIQPDVLLCRADRAVPDEEREKISLFTNVQPHGVISMWDVDTIYKVPRMLHEQGLDEMICMKLQLLTKPADLKRWDRLVHEVENPAHAVSIAMCGKYTDLSDSYKSLNEALRHAGIQHHARVNIDYLDSEALNAGNIEQLARFDAVLVPGGFGKRGIEGKISRGAVRARARHSLPGHLPGHAGRDDRVRAPQGRSGGCQQHRVRCRDAEPGDRADRRMAGPRRHACKSAAPAPTWAAPCAWARKARTCSAARWRTRSTAMSSPNATATATRPTNTISSGCAKPGW